MKARYAIYWSWADHLDAISEDEAKEKAVEHLLSDVKNTEILKRHLKVEKMWNIRTLEEPKT